MNSGCAAALDRLQDFCFMAIKAANREPCTPPQSTLILTPAFVVYTELGIDPYFCYDNVTDRIVIGHVGNHLDNHTSLSV